MYLGLEVINACKILDVAWPVMLSTILIYKVKETVDIKVMLIFLFIS